MSEALRAEIARLTRERADVLEALVDTIGQACTFKDGKLDSQGLHAFADAIRLLAAHGHVVIEREHGRRVIAHWRVPEPPDA